MVLIQNDHVIEQLASNTSNQPLGVCVLPRRCGRCHDFLNSQRTQFPADLLATNRITVSQQIARHRLKWKCLDQLLRRPFGGWMLGHIEVKHPAPVMAEDHQDKKHFQLGRWHDEEIYCRESLGV
jgi:hypothetical protein